MISTIMRAMIFQPASTVRSVFWLQRRTEPTAAVHPSWTGLFALRAQEYLLTGAFNRPASPEPIEDTFGIASVGNLSGVKIDTPQGTVWTDTWGRAVIPRLPAFGKGEI